MQQTAHRHIPLQTVGFAHPKRNVAAFGIQGGMRVVDFGAGSGAYVLAIAERLGGTGTVYAIDVQRDLLRKIHNEAVRLGHKNVEVIWADLETPRASKLADGSIDLVLVSNLLFQIPDKVPVLREARRIVKSTGTVVVIDWSDSFGGMGPHPDEVMSEVKATGFFEKHGFTKNGPLSVGAHHYGMILQRK